MSQTVEASKALMDSLITRALLAVLALVFLLALSPTPTAQPLVEQLRVAVLAYQNGHPGVALESLEDVMAFEPVLAGQLHRPAAEVALVAGAPERALEHLDRTKGRGRVGEALRCMRLEALLDLDREWEAQNLLAAGVLSCPQAEALHRRMVDRHLANGDPARALVELDRLAAWDPMNAEVRMLQAILRAIEQPETAVPALRLADSLAPQGNELARALIRAILDARPAQDPAFTHAQVGQTLARAGAWDFAAWAFHRAVALEPGYVEALAYLGLAQDRSGGDGLAELLQAADAAPAAALPQLFLGKHWRARGALEESKAAYEKAASLDPQDPAIAADLGATYALLGDFPAALASYRYAVSLAPEDPGFWRLLAEVSLGYEVEVETTGIPAARNALLLSPGDPAALDSLGYGYFLLGNFTLAERFLTLASRQNPTLASVYYHLGLLRAEEGDLARARSVWEAAIVLDPAGNVGRMAQRSLDNLPADS